jgi:hypothetical protein
MDSWLTPAARALRTAARASAVLGGAALLLAACVTAPPPSLSLDEIRSMKLVGVELQNPGVVHSWPAGEEAYVASGKADPDIVKRLPNESAQNFPQLQAVFQPMLQQRFAAELDGTVAPVLQGARPVKAVVHLKEFDVPSGARRAIIDGSAKLQADVDLVDAKTGAVLLSYRGPMKAVNTGPTVALALIGGLGAIAAADAKAPSGEPGSALVAAYAADYLTWLVTR